MTAPVEIHPVSPWQNLMISTRNDPKTSDGFHQKMIIRWAHLITPNVDERRLKRAFDALVKRHDSLRLEFVQEHNGDWRAAILGKHKTGLVSETFGEVDDKSFQEILNQRATAPLDVLNDPLFQMHLLKFSDRGDVILMRAHHAILDGYSAVMLVEELFQNFLNVPPSTRAISHGEYVRFLTAELARNLPEKNQFWENELLPMGSAPNLGRKAKGKPGISGFYIENTSRLNGLVSTKELQQIETQTAAQGHSLFAHLFTAFADVLCDESGSDEFYLATVVGRTDPVLSGFIGSASTLMIVKYVRTPTDDLPQKVQRTADKIRMGIAHLPWRGHVAGGAVTEAFAENNRDFQQFMVTLPEALGRERRSSFSDTLASGREGIISFGHFKVQQIDLAEPPSTNAELELSLMQGSDGYELRFGADSDAFTIAELETLRSKLRQKLGLCG